MADWPRARIVSLQLWNVRTRQKETFAPRDPARVGMYVCGLTVYDHMHIGHARTAVSFEVIRRWIERSWPLKFVQNVTDVDDKIIARAEELGVSPRAHAAKWDMECRKQSARLGVREPDEAPHATTSMAGIITFIEKIIERGYAYATPSGNVYFDVPKYDAYAQEAFPEAGYGSLSRRDYREMAAGTRKQVESDKQHPADFALWKAAKPDEPKGATWESPWGDGRPGWHIECSHMSTHTLESPSIDIHGGGQDLIFPHHENEIAQSQAASGEAPFSNFWVHTGFLNVEGQKMSKSLGNFITLHEMLDELEAQGRSPDVLRLYFAQTHYRSKIDFSRKGLDEAATALERLERTRSALAAAPPPGDAPAGDAPLLAAATALEQAFNQAMDDDIHTPGALAAMFAFVRAANAALDADHTAGSQGALATFEECGQFLTLFQAPPAPLQAEAPEHLKQLLEERETARASKDWSRADAIRDEIHAAGFEIEDTPKGARLRAK